MEDSCVDALEKREAGCTSGVELVVTVLWDAWNCNLSLMNYLFLELSIQYFWTVIDWITEPSERKRCRKSCPGVLAVSPL